VQKRARGWEFFVIIVSFAGWVCEKIALNVAQPIFVNVYT
jgi:hypothetical protein